MRRTRRLIVPAEERVPVQEPIAAARGKRVWVDIRGDRLVEREDHYVYLSRSALQRAAHRASLRQTPPWSAWHRTETS
jgi:hypothetical protein